MTAADQGTCYQNGSVGLEAERRAERYETEGNTGMAEHTRSLYNLPSKLAVTPVDSSGGVVHARRLKISTVGRFIVWLLCMASGIVVIPLSIVMCFGFFPASLGIGLPMLFGWGDWVEDVYRWMWESSDLSPEMDSRLPV